VSVVGHCAHRTDAPIEVEDTASLSLKFQSGLLATVHFGYLLASGTAGYVGASYDTYIGMKGSTGSFSWSPHGATQQLVRAEVAGTRKEIPCHLLPSPAYGGYYGERFVRDFLLMAMDKQPAPLLPTVADIQRLLRLFDAAYESSQAGRAAQPVA
jgi:predicted dehydrogenase